MSSEKRWPATLTTSTFLCPSLGQTPLYHIYTYPTDSPPWAQNYPTEWAKKAFIEAVAKCCHNIFVNVSFVQCSFRSKGSHPFKKVQFFFNIVQKAFDPPPLLFEHLSYFAGGVFWTHFWAFDIMYLFYPQISPSMPQKSLFMQISCC